MLADRVRMGTNKEKPHELIHYPIADVGIYIGLPALNEYLTDEVWIRVTETYSTGILCLFDLEKFPSEQDIKTATLVITGRKYLSNYDGRISGGVTREQDIWNEQDRNAPVIQTISIYNRIDAQFTSNQSYSTLRFDYTDGLKRMLQNNYPNLLFYRYNSSSSARMLTRKHENIDYRPRIELELI